MGIRERFAMILGHLRGTATFVALRVTPIALLVMLALPARAQFIGFTSPQTVQQTLATNVSCTGAQQLFTVQNLGQNQHFATLDLTGNTEVVKMNIVTFDASNIQTAISDDVVLAGPGLASGIVYGTGYFPIVKVNVTCASAFGTFTVNYSGTSANAPQISGNYQLTQQSKKILGSTANAVHFISIQTPFGSSAAMIRAQYTVAAVAGSTLAIGCDNGLGGFTHVTFSLANVTTLQTFNVPPIKCSTMGIQYNSGGATVGGINAFLTFEQPGTSNTQVANYVHIANTTATVAKADAGTLQSLTVGTPAAGTITVHDLAPAACVMTPGTNIVAVFTEQAAGTPATHPVNLFFNFGICIKASATMDITAGVQ